MVETRVFIKLEKTYESPTKHVVNEIFFLTVFGPTKIAKIKSKSVRKGYAEFKSHIHTRKNTRGTWKRTWCTRRERDNRLDDDVCNNNDSYYNTGLTHGDGTGTVRSGVLFVRNGHHDDASRLYHCPRVHRG